MHFKFFDFCVCLKDFRDDVGETRSSGTVHWPAASLFSGFEKGTYFF